MPSPHSWNNLLQKAVTLYNNKHYSENKLKVLLGAVSLMTVEHRTNQYGYHDEVGNSHVTRMDLGRTRMDFVRLN